METENLNNDLAKELFIVLSYCDESLIEKIPNDFLNILTDLAADSKKEFYIIKNKSLEEQNISDNCKNLLGLLYYAYVLNDSSKKEILKNWLKNEINY